MSVSIPSRPGGRQRNRIQLLPPLEGRMLPVCCNASSPMLMELIYALNLVYLTTLPGTCESQPWVLSWWRLPWCFSWDHGLTNWTNNGPTHTHTHTHIHTDWRHTQISCSGTTITCIILNVPIWGYTSMHTHIFTVDTNTHRTHITQPTHHQHTTHTIPGTDMRILS